MKIFFTFLSVCFLGMSFAQTTEYSTGQTYGDAWTGWSTPIETGTTTSSVNGADIYTFSGTNGQAYTVETYRQFTINSNDIDIYFSATCENAVISVEYSSDNVSYTQIGSLTYGSGFGNQTLIIPTYDPVVTTYYLKLKVAGTFGSPSSLQLNSFKIDAVLNSGSASISAEEAPEMNYFNNQLQIKSASADYRVSIFDLAGKLRHQESGLSTYDFSAFDSGIYFVTLQNDKGLKKTIKVVKQ